MWYRKDIVRQFHSTLKDEQDVHSRLMQYYPEVPMWWYVIIGVITFAFICIATKMVPNQLPLWAAVIGILLSFALAIPMTTLHAITNQPAPGTAMYELIAGYMLPGQPIANMIFKAIVFMTINQATSFALHMKLGHYMKVPPRIMFSTQTVATIISCIWVTFIQDWMLNNIQDICTPHQKQGFICPGSTTFATASIIFGAVGPQRLFSPGALYVTGLIYLVLINLLCSCRYSALLWFFPVGLLAPIPFYLLAHHFPLGIWRYINIPVFFNTLTFMPEFSGINYSSWVLCGFIFNYLIRRFHLRWWMRYNYILSIALDSGTAISMLVVFFTLTLSKRGGIALNWWGNT